LLALNLGGKTTFLLLQRPKEKQLRISAKLTVHFG
jgi:hypothetical protein